MDNRAHNTLYGLYIGDALAMPVHWYYNRQTLRRDYGWVVDFITPRNPHPDSILWRSSYRAQNARGEILHDHARQAALEHLALTHPGYNMQTAASLLIDILLKVLHGIGLKTALIEEIKAQGNPLLGHPFMKWLDDPDDRVIGPRLSSACYVEDAVPAVVYLALKYHDQPEKALIVSTNLGGDNVGRGSILGSLLGASHGMEAFPRRWVDGLVDPPPEFPPG